MSEKNIQEGTDLGLTISQQFTRLMGGEIRVRSEAGIGSLFSFTIKTKDANHPSIISEIIERRVFGLAPNSPNSNCRILIVDDNATNRKVLKTLLSRLGLELEDVDNGNKAIAVWKTWNAEGRAPDLIWLDMRMPEMDGLEVIKRIKELDQNKMTTIISISASVFEEDKKNAFKAGCDGFVRKPFKESEIFEEMKKHLNLKYVYETKKPDGLSKNKKLIKQSSIDPINSLPDAWRSSMVKAISQVDTIKIDQLISELEKTDENLASIFQRQLDLFEYDQLLTQLQ